MRKETKKLKHPNVIIDSLEKPIYASTYIDYSCDVRGPKCSDEPIPENDYWKSGWKDGDDFGHINSYDFHICPDCQETNCMKCFEGLLNKDNGQCSNKNCENHTHCKNCGEEFFTHPYGDDYCINPYCENSGGDTVPKLATRNYWIQCDMPDCESDGWNPEYDRMPKGWHRIDHDRSGDSSTDYCEDCWDTGVCHECENPYTNEEEKFTNKSVCKTPSCDVFNKCQHCHGDINEFGNCDKPEDGYGDCWTCRHCDQDLDKRGNCLNDKCKAYNNPLTKAFFEKEAHYTYKDDPDYPDDPVSYINCDYPNCKKNFNTEMPIYPFHMHSEKDLNYNEKHYCPDHWDNEVCHSCATPKDMYGRCTNGRCKEFTNCPECDEKTDSNGICYNKDCSYENLSRTNCPECCNDLTQYGHCKTFYCKKFVNPYDDIFSDPS